MQYILTEEEYTALKAAAQAQLELNTKGLQELCTKIMPVLCGWSRDEQPKPWGCIHSSERGEWYCDQCPVRTICPTKYKRYSK
jgi:hypothetical protein